MKRMTFSLAAALLLNVSLAADASAQTLTWSRNCHEYQLVQLPGVTWQTAFVAAQSLGEGWYLATVTSQEENDFIYQNLVATTVVDDPLAAYPGNIEWWLGGIQFASSDTDSRLNWRWTTGEKWNYAHWNVACVEPSGGEFFLGMWGPDSGYRSGVGGFWNDEGDLENIKGYIAEKGLQSHCAD